MSKPITIEVDGEAVGIARPEDGSYRFFAVKYAVWPLDGRSFASVTEAMKAAGHAMSPVGQDTCAACLG